MSKSAHKNLTFREAENSLMLADSYSRLSMIVGLADRMTHKSWFKLLGCYWSTCDNISETLAGVDCGDHITDLIDSVTIPQMMTRLERGAFAELPDTVTIYRGCFDGVNVDGCSWSLDQSVARKFPTLRRYQVSGAVPVLLSATVEKHCIVALKLDREESEVITFMADVFATERLDAEQRCAQFNMIEMAS